MSLPVLQVKGLDKSYIGVHALDHVDFDLNEMEIHALLGEKLQNMLRQKEYYW